MDEAIDEVLNIELDDYGTQVYKLVDVNNVKQALLATIADSLEKELEGIIGIDYEIAYMRNGPVTSPSGMGRMKLREEQRQRAAEYIKRLRGNK